MESNTRLVPYVLAISSPHKSSGKQYYFHFTTKHPEAQRGSEHILGEKIEIEMF